MVLYDDALQRAYNEETRPESPVDVLGAAKTVPRFGTVSTPSSGDKRPGSAMSIGNYSVGAAPSAPPSASYKAKKPPTLNRLYKKFYWHQTEAWENAEGGSPQPNVTGSSNISSQPTESSALFTRSPVRYNSQVLYSPELHKPLKLYFILGFIFSPLWLLTGLRYRNNKDLYVRQVSRWMLILWAFWCGVMSLLVAGALAVFYIAL